MLSGPNATSSRTVGMKSWSSGSWKIRPTRAAHVAQRLRPDPHAGDLELALAGQQPVEPQHQRRLAGAVRAEDGDALAVRHVQVDAVERDVAVGVAVADAVGVDGAAHRRNVASRSGTRNEQRRPRRTARPRGRRSSGTRCGMRAVVAAAQHREVDALAAGVAAQEERARDAADGAGAEQRARAVAARVAGRAHPLHLVDDDEQVAVHEGGDQRQRAGHPQRLERRAAPAGRPSSRRAGRPRRCRSWP